MQGCTEKYYFEMIKNGKLSFEPLNCNYFDGMTSNLNSPLHYYLRMCALNRQKLIICKAFSSYEKEKKVTLYL